VQREGRERSAAGGRRRRRGGGGGRRMGASGRGGASGKEQRMVCCAPWSREGGSGKQEGGGRGAAEWEARGRGGVGTAKSQNVENGGCWAELEYVLAPSGPAIKPLAGAPPYFSAHFRPSPMHHVRLYHHHPLIAFVAVTINHRPTHQNPRSPAAFYFLATSNFSHTTRFRRTLPQFHFRPSAPAAPDPDKPRPLAVQPACAHKFSRPAALCPTPSLPSLPDRGACLRTDPSAAQFSPLQASKLFFCPSLDRGALLTTIPAALSPRPWPPL
jgi:hypothetical protein